MKTRSKIFFTLLLLPFLIGSCGVFHRATEEDFEFRDLSFEQIEFHLVPKSKDTNFIVGILKENTIIDGYPCKAGTKTYFSKDWQLTKCRLSEDFYFYENKLPMDTWLWLSSDNQKIVCTFPDEVIIQGYTLFGNNNKNGKKGIPTTFYTSGELCTFYPKDEATVSGYICRLQMRYPITIYPSGNLKQAILAEPYTIDGVNYDKNTWIMLDEEGKVLKSK